MIADLNFEAYNRFLEYCGKPEEDTDLEAGAWLLAQTKYPDIDIAVYRKQINEHAIRLSRKISAESSIRECLTSLNAYLFDELGFHGNSTEYYDADNSYMNKVLDRRTGIPISLCALYQFICKRLNIDVCGVGMPGHFICYCDLPEEDLFIDVFNNGKFMTRGDCVEYLKRSGQQRSLQALNPFGAKRTLMRMCSNLYQIYLQKDHPVETRWHQEFIKALGED